ncbi:MAG: DUF3874 domain-containing protein, partial [Flavobacteriales bacterium]|nr:DUF3874 domain-containing protein [Flavobacteriales bacterium]
NSAFTTIAPEEELLLKTFAPSPNVDALTPSQIRSLENNNAIKLLTCTEIYNELQRQTSARLSMHKISHFLKKHGFRNLHRKYGFTTKRVYILKTADNEHEF